jgi:hypothetical protein
MSGGLCFVFFRIVGRLPGRRTESRFLRALVSSRKYTPCGPALIFFGSLSNGKGRARTNRRVRATINGEEGEAEGAGYVIILDYAFTALACLAGR